jgi:hypothetical protein
MSSQTVTAEPTKAASVAAVRTTAIEPSNEPTVETSGAADLNVLRKIAGAGAADSSEAIASAITHTARSPAAKIGLVRNLQRQYGNAYVGRVIQAKLAVGAPGDSYEREADHVANMVMRMPAPGSPGGVAGPGIGPRIQRMCLDCEEELQMQPMKEKEEERRRLQKKDSGAGEQGLSAAAESNVAQVRGSAGSPLTDGVRSFFEDRFGEDFSGVRVHTDNDAGSSARELGALAYTVGRDIVFGTGQYQPESLEGQKLIAHELTHVVQQGGSTSRAQRSLVEQHSGTVMVHGAWTHPGAMGTTSQSVSTSGNGAAGPVFFPRGVYGQAITWQTPEPPEVAWCIDGGTAAVSATKSTQYTFQHDGADNDFLELTISAEISGGAKAEDLHYAKSGAVVAGLIKVRTPANPTPPAVELFRIDDGGKSSAEVSTVADIDVTVPIDGTIRVKIPLKAVSEGSLSPFSETLVPPRSHDVAGSTGAETIVDLYLGAYVEVAADIETNCWIDIGGDVNWGRAMGRWDVTWRGRAAPRRVSPTPPEEEYGPRTDCPQSPAYRTGARTGKNLTPRPQQDVPSGLSLTTTETKKVRFPGGKSRLTSLGFELEDDPTTDDPCHLLLRPGPGHISRGWTLERWAATRDTLDPNDSSTWHELTRILYDNSEVW